MAAKRLLTEFGMGASLRRQDYTQAAVRGVQDALWHNSINLAELFGKAKTDMLIDVEVAVQNPCGGGHVNARGRGLSLRPSAGHSGPWRSWMCRGQMGCPR